MEPSTLHEGKGGKKKGPPFLRAKGGKKKSPMSSVVQNRKGGRKGIRNGPHRAKEEPRTFPANRKGGKGNEHNIIWGGRKKGGRKDCTFYLEKKKSGWGSPGEGKKEHFSNFRGEKGGGGESTCSHKRGRLNEWTRERRGREKEDPLSQNVPGKGRGENQHIH